METHPLLEKLMYIHRYLSELEARVLAFEGEDIYPAELHSMEVIEAAAGENGSRIAELLGVTRAAVSKSAKKLMVKGFLARQMAGDSRRDYQYRLTPKGHRALEFHRTHEKKLFSKYISLAEGLAPPAQQSINNFLDKLIDLSKGKEM